MQIYGREVMRDKDPDDVLSWLRTYHPTLLNLLLLQDEFVSGLIFDDTDTHTISWHIATMASDGSLVAKIVCEALNFLSSDHCAHTLTGGV